MIWWFEAEGGPIFTRSLLLLIYECPSTESVCWHVLALDGCLNILFEYQFALRNTVCSLNISLMGSDLQRPLGSVHVSVIVVNSKECTVCAFWFVWCLLSVCRWLKKVLLSSLLSSVWERFSHVSEDKGCLKESQKSFQPVSSQISMIGSCSELIFT